MPLNLFQPLPPMLLKADGSLESLGVEGALFGRPVIVLARERCLFESFNASAARSNSAALTAARLHAEVGAPYQTPGFLITHSSRSFGIWWWDADWVLAQLELHNAPVDSVIMPETLLQAPASGVRLLKGTSGYEAQAWDKNYLIADLWRRNAFDDDAWASFTRQLPSEMQATTRPSVQRVPLVLDSPYRRTVVTSLITRDVLVLAGCLGVTVLLATTAFLAGSGISLNRRADQLRVNIATEQAKIADRIRGQAQVAQLQTLQREIGRPDALTLLSKAQAIILPFGYKIDVFTATRRSVSITLPEEAVAGVDLICTELNSSPYFQNATPKLDHAKKKLLIDLEVRGSGDLKALDPVMIS
jgi:hypothetical protein